MIARRLFSEGLGTAILVAAVVGSGIMAERLAGGNQAIALLGNTLPTGAILVVLISILGPVSGAHFNPAVTLVFAARGDMPWREVLPYIVVQFAGGVAGTIGWITKKPGEPKHAACGRPSNDLTRVPKLRPGMISAGFKGHSVPG